MFSRFLLFCISWLLVGLLHGWYYYCSNFFPWIPPCRPCPVIVTEIRCLTDGSDNHLSVASNNHLDVDLISVPPYTSTWNYLFSSLTEYQRFTSFTCFSRAHELNDILNNMSMCRTSVCFYSLSPFSLGPDDQAPNMASQQSSSMSCAATLMANYSCFLPAPFDGTTDFQDFVTQFNSVFSLSDWENQLSGDLCPQIFSDPSVAMLLVSIAS